MDAHSSASSPQAVCQVFIVLIYFEYGLVRTWKRRVKALTGIQNSVPFGTKSPSMWSDFAALRSVIGTGGITRRLSILKRSVKYGLTSSIKSTYTTQSSHFMSRKVL